MQDTPGKSVDRTRVTLLMLLSISMVSSASVLIKMSASDALVITFWRTLYGAIMMASIGAVKGDLSEFRGPVLKKNWVWLVLIGFILSLHFSTWFASLKLTNGSHHYRDSIYGDSWRVS
jgi:drug/metabolite transporter (DMT)-like permease